LSLTIWKNRLRLFENKLLKRIFRPKREDVTGGWRKVYNEELHEFSSLLIIISAIKFQEMNVVLFEYLREGNT
jgi:hypothetical protein